MIDPQELPGIEEIETWRKTNAISRIDLADQLGVSLSIYTKWCSPKSSKDIPLYKRAEMQQHMRPRKEALPDRISVDASWEEIQRWSKAFKKSNDPDLQTWMLNKLNEAAEQWAAEQDSLSDHRPASIEASGPVQKPASQNGNGQSGLAG